MEIFYLMFFLNNEKFLKIVFFFLWGIFNFWKFVWWFSEDMFIIKCLGKSWLMVVIFLVMWSGWCKGSIIVDVLRVIFFVWLVRYVK